MTEVCIQAKYIYVDSKMVTETSRSKTRERTSNAADLNTTNELPSNVYDSRQLVHSAHSRGFAYLVNTVKCR